MHDIDAKRNGGSDPELVGLKALQFVAEHTEELERFLALSGVDPADLPRLARDTDFICGILDFMLADEALLLVFSEESGLSPHTVTAARLHLETGSRPLDSGEI